ncbi:MAG: thiamine pyrophosphate-dependent enzyme [Candidatus Micrarchaeia archaeon]|jgi:2-oxoglutarate ferredoxin oxidoreductase subunit beta
MATLEDFNVKEKPQWCPGCGDFAINMAIKNALVEVGAEPHNTVIVSGVGCSGKMPHYVRSYGFESLHGRVLPPASGIKLANHELNVIGVGGDGDGYGIGMGHFIHIMRRNYDLTYIVHDNQVYGLTTGQTAPTSQRGVKTKSTPYGNLEDPVHPLPLALTMGATYVARGFAGDMKHLSTLIAGGIKHKGFALIDVLQPCVTFNKINTYQYWQQRCYKLEEQGHDASSHEKAMEKANEDWKTNYEKIPIGLFYKENKPTYESGLPQLKTPLVKHDLKQAGLEEAMDEFI